MALKLVSLNIEGNLHIDKVTAFLKEQNPDVVCLQELLEPDIKYFEEFLGPCFYTPMMRMPAGTRLAQNTEAVAFGLGIFSHIPGTNETREYYHRVSEEAPDFIDGSADDKRKTQNLMVALKDFEKEGKLYRVATTHFTWTPDGEPDDYQKTDVEKMLGLLKPHEPLLLCGDMNAPRGKAVFSKLAEHYKDNIPAEYKGSIDISLHRAGATAGEHLAELMVDGLFTTPEYETSAVALVPGVSDHCAIVATIERV